MEGQKKRIHRDYEPLTASVSLSVESGGSPATQVYDAASGEYDPDRSITPTVIRPIVTAGASDGSWPNADTNKYLADIKWFVNGKNITTITDWEGKYEISNIEETKGQIVVKKNFLPSERVGLRFEAVVVDGRFGVNVPVISEELILSTFDKGLDAWSVSIGDSQIIQYNPFKDKLFRREYQLAHGITPTDTEAVAEADVDSYLRTIPMTVNKGGVPVTEGFGFSLYKVNSNGALSHVAINVDDEIQATSIGSITIDFRLVEKCDYMIVIDVNGGEVARIQFSVNRVYPAFTCVPANGTSINSGDRYYLEEVMVNSDGKKVVNPESIIKIDWYTDTAGKKKFLHHEGARTVIDLTDTGIGSQWPDDWMDVYTEAQQKPAHCVATDGTDVWTDENGNDLIFN